MNRMIFEGLLKEREERIAAIRDAACRLHDSVGQTYDMTHPYGFHLQSVAAQEMASSVSFTCFRIFRSSTSR